MIDIHQDQLCRSCKKPSRFRRFQFPSIESDLEQYKARMLSPSTTAKLEQKYCKISNYQLYLYRFYSWLHKLGNYQQRSSRKSLDKDKLRRQNLLAIDLVMQSFRRSDSLQQCLSRSCMSCGTIRMFLSQSSRTFLQSSTNHKQSPVARDLERQSFRRSDSLQQCLSRSYMSYGTVRMFLSPYSRNVLV